MPFHVLCHECNFMDILFILLKLLCLLQFYDKQWGTLNLYVCWNQSQSELFSSRLLYKEFMKKLEEKRMALNKASSMGEAILTICHPDSITTIKHWNTIIKARFEEVSSQLHSCIYAFQLCHTHRYEWSSQFGCLSSNSHPNDWWCGLNMYTCLITHSCYPPV